MPLYLVRHGQTAWNEAGRAQGHTDIPLDETGLHQARCLEHAFHNVSVDEILSSDLRRAYVTAESIANATGAHIVRTANLRERSFGDWEGTNFEHVNRQLEDMAESSGRTFLEVAPPNGESYADVWRRLDPVLDPLLANPDRNVVIASHGGTLSVVLAKLIRGTLETARSFRLKNTAITELVIRPDGYMAIARFNDISHLDQSSQIAATFHGTPR